MKRNLKLRIIGIYNTPTIQLAPEQQCVIDMMELAFYLKKTFQEAVKYPFIPETVRDLLKGNTTIIFRDQNFRRYAYNTSKGIARVTNVFYDSVKSVAVPFELKNWFTPGEKYWFRKDKMTPEQHEERAKGKPNSGCCLLKTKFQRYMFVTAYYSDPSLEMCKEETYPDEAEELALLFQKSFRSFGKKRYMTDEMEDILRGNMVFIITDEVGNEYAYSHKKGIVRMTNLESYDVSPIPDEYRVIPFIPGTIIPLNKYIDEINHPICNQTEKKETMKNKRNEELNAELTLVPDGKGYTFETCDGEEGYIPECAITECVIVPNSQLDANGHIQGSIRLYKDDSGKYHPSHIYLHGCTGESLLAEEYNFIGTHYHPSNNNMKPESLYVEEARELAPYLRRSFASLLQQQDEIVDSIFKERLDPEKNTVFLFRSKKLNNVIAYSPIDDTVRLSHVDVSGSARHHSQLSKAFRLGEKWEVTPSEDVIQEIHLTHKEPGNKYSVTLHNVTATIKRALLPMFASTLYLDALNEDGKAFHIEKKVKLNSPDDFLAFLQNTKRGKITLCQKAAGKPYVIDYK